MGILKDFRPLLAEKGHFLKKIRPSAIVINGVPGAGLLEAIEEG